MPYADPEKNGAFQRAYRVSHRAEQREYNATYRVERAEQLREQGRRRYALARAADPGALRERNRRRWLMKAYRVTPEQIDELRAAQGSRCAICLRRLPMAELHIDHNHNSGAIRGLLCGSCNRALGLLRDSPSLAERAACYLRTGLQVFVQ